VPRGGQTHAEVRKRWKKGGAWRFPCAKTEGEIGEEGEKGENPAAWARHVEEGGSRRPTRHVIGRGGQRSTRCASRRGGVLVHGPLWAG
jgi:hypothetical protein